MATSALVRLQRVLDLEERQGWRNRAVIGGLQAMATRWVEDARAEGVGLAIVERAGVLMGAYGRQATAERAETAALLRRVLEGDVEAMSAPIPEPAAAEPPAPPVAPLPPLPPVTVNPPHTGAPVKPAAQDRPAGTESDGEGPPEMVLGSTYVYEYEEQSAVPAAAQERPRSPRPGRKDATLDSPPTVLQGVGVAVADHLRKLGIEHVGDLLWNVPFRYEDFTQLKTIADLRPGEQATIVANLWEKSERNVGINKKVFEGILGDSTGTITAKFWSKWALAPYPKGATLRMSGKVGVFMGKKTLESPVVEDADTEALAAGRLAPVYSLTEGIAQKKMRLLTRQALEEYVDLVPDPLPASLRRKYDLLPIVEALWGIHFPEDHAQLEAARRRLAFEEFFYVQLGVQQRRRELKGESAPDIPADQAMLEQFAAAMPYPLTAAQERVLREIALDVSQPVPMTRLLQGDVGSGKTAVAAGAMYLAVRNGQQAAMLAPTQILAEQHHRGLARLLDSLAHPDGAPIQVALLTGRVQGSERQRVLDGLRDGSIDVVVGTTALVQDRTEFADLALVVVDEQHRFGVEQRGALRSKAERHPHVLVMSATPIPRSLALTLYGDLDVSKLDEMPPGRTPIKTVLFRPTERERVYGFVRREAQAGRQAFIVYPLVEESESLEAGAATQEYERLRTEVFPDLRLALLHGQMRGADKDTVMSAFAAGELDVLVSTSVIEVGIDVPNASVIIIEDAERFGLAQLHQFRGRVGRGKHKSFCVLVSRAEADASEERLRVLEATTDGFVLAEKDLELRGPGDFLGKRQSGLPDLRMAQLSDVATLVLARDAAQAYFAEDPDLVREPQLAEQVARFWRGEGDIN